MEEYTIDELKTILEYCLKDGNCESCCLKNEACTPLFGKAFFKLLNEPLLSMNEDLRSDNKLLTMENQRLKNEALKNEALKNDDVKKLVNSLNGEIDRLRTELDEEENFNIEANNLYRDKIDEIEDLEKELKKENITNKIMMKLLHQSGNNNLKAIMADIVELGGLYAQA
jgi:hypothetical protein